MKHHGLHASLPIAINMVPNLMAQYGDRRIFFENHPCLVKKTTLETEPASVGLKGFHCGAPKDSVLLGYNTVSMGNQIPSSSSRVNTSWTVRI